MEPILTILLMAGSLLALILIGVPIALSLGLVSFIFAIFILGNVDTALSLLSTITYRTLNNYLFGVIPLFMLMGTLMSRSGVAGDIFDLTSKVLKKVPGGLAVATIIGNTIFAAVTGVSVAAAAVFSKIAYPEMKRLNYSKNLSLSSIAGGSVIGMIIPPSALFIVYGLISGLGIGKLFIAGILPGILLSIIFCLLIIFMVKKNPSLAGSKFTSEDTPSFFSRQILGAAGVLFTIFIVLGGVWLGWFTPTEAAGIGVISALLVAIIKRISLLGIWEAVWEAATATAPVFLLLIAGSLFSRVIALTGIIRWIEQSVHASDLPNIVIFLGFIAIWFVLGFVIDVTSIILITIPTFAPIAATLGYDPLLTAVVAIVTIQVGQLTPPFGMCVYATKSAIDDPDVTIEGIFRSSLPFALVMLASVGILMLFPAIVTWLPSLM